MSGPLKARRKSAQSRTVPARLAANLNNWYRRFLSADDADKKYEAGKELIRAIFGIDAIAEDSIGGNLLDAHHRKSEAAGRPILKTSGS
jgi:hypothetical protein